MQVKSAAGDNSCVVEILALKGIEPEAWHVESVADFSTSYILKQEG